MKVHAFCFSERLRVFDGVRVSPEAIDVELFDGKHRIFFDERAERSSNLVIFDGHDLRDGYPRGCTPLAIQVEGVRHAPRTLVMERETTRGKVRLVDRQSGLPRDRDEVDFVDDRALFRTVRFALQFPRGKDGKKGLFMRPKPLSLEREYVMIVSYETYVEFLTCVSF